VVTPEPEPEVNPEPDEAPELRRYGRQHDGSVRFPDGSVLDPPDADAPWPVTKAAPPVMGEAAWADLYRYTIACELKVNAHYAEGQRRIAKERVNAAKAAELVYPDAAGLAAWTWDIARALGVPMNMMRPQDPRE
jgi:hypothetical protein